MKNNFNPLNSLGKILIVIVLIGLLCVQFPMKAQSISANPRTSIYFEYEDTIILSKLAPDQDFILLFPIIVHCNMSKIDEAVREIIVEIGASVDQNWTVNVIPQTVIFQESGSERVNITITAPPETSYYSSGQFSLGGTVTYNPGGVKYKIMPVTGTIKINQYYLVSINCTDPIKEIGSGRKTTYEINISNEGNARDKFKINIVNLDELIMEGFELELDHDTIEIPEKDHITILLNVTAPNNVTANKNYEIKLNVFSLQAKLNENKTIEHNLTLSANVFSFDHNCQNYLDGSPAIIVLASIFGIIFLIKLIKKLEKSRNNLK